MFSKFLMSVVACPGLLFATPSLVRADDDADSVRVQTIARALKDADRHAAAERLVQAEKSYKKVLALDPKNVPALAGLAWVYNHRGDYDAAVDAADDALEIDPTNSPVWRESGYGLWKKGKKWHAVLALRKAIEHDTRNWGAYDYLTTILEDLKESPAADLVRRQKQEEKKAAVSSRRVVA
ncbi:MAG: Tetratricopeptide repeat [Gemmataceae bacterium]|nr:Tetratricopeptide repeat [Gemmataceae bacterium]